MNLYDNPTQDQAAYNEFKSIMKEMIELEKQICELKYFALRHGIDVQEIMPDREVA